MDCVYLGFCGSQVSVTRHGRHLSGAGRGAMIQGPLLGADGSSPNLTNLTFSRVISQNCPGRYISA